MTAVPTAFPICIKDLLLGKYGTISRAFVNVSDNSE